jgi:serine O-acetyltransferase
MAVVDNAGMDNNPPDEEKLSQAHARGCARSLSELSSLLKADLYRYAAKSDLHAFLTHMMFSPGFICTFWIRTTGYAKTGRIRKLLLYPVAKTVLLWTRYKYHIAIPEYTVIGPGLLIEHFGAIYVNGDAIIGRNVTLTPGNMLGQANRGPLRGSPILGDRVYMGAGAKVVGRVRVGDGAVIGANSVVTKDVPARGVVVGMPGKVISLAGSDEYTINPAS